MTHTATMPRAGKRRRFLPKQGSAKPRGHAVVHKDTQEPAVALLVPHPLRIKDGKKERDFLNGAVVVKTRKGTRLMTPEAFRDAFFTARKGGNARTDNLPHITIAMAQKMRALA